jgi:hypothetical protein
MISSEGGITRIFSEAKTMGKEGRVIIEEYISEQVYSTKLEYTTTISDEGGISIIFSLLKQ